MTAREQIRDHLSERAEPPRPVVSLIVRNAFARDLDRLVSEADPILVRSRALLADALLSVSLHAKQHGENRCDSRSPRTPEQFGDRNRR